MQSLLMLLSSSLLTCDIYSIKKIYILKAFLLFTFNKFCIENVYNGTSAKTGPAEFQMVSGSNASQYGSKVFMSVSKEQ